MSDLGYALVCICSAATQMLIISVFCPSQSNKQQQHRPQTPPHVLSLLRSRPDADGNSDLVCMCLDLVTQLWTLGGKARGGRGEGGVNIGAIPPAPPNSSFLPSLHTCSSLLLDPNNQTGTASCQPISLIFSAN